MGYRTRKKTANGKVMGRPRKDDKERTVLAGGFTVLEGLAEEFKLMAEFLGVNQSEHFSRVAEEYLMRKKEEYGVFSIGELIEKNIPRQQKREKNRADVAYYLDEQKEEKVVKRVRLRKKKEKSA